MVLNFWRNLLHLSVNFANYIEFRRKGNFFLRRDITSVLSCGCVGVPNILLSKINNFDTFYNIHQFVEESLN